MALSFQKERHQASDNRQKERRMLLSFLTPGAWRLLPGLDYHTRPTPVNRRVPKLLDISKPFF
jgi:hypothetical protein